MLTLSSNAVQRIRSFQGKAVGVVGLGREGVDLVRCLAGWGAQVTVSDKAGPEELVAGLAALRGIAADYLLGRQQANHLLHCEEIFVSPGVPPEAEVVVAARERGITISSSTRLFFELCPGRLAGITGSSGKTTTTSLVGAMASAAGLDVLVGGNIGAPMLEHLPRITLASWSVLELSSFQLADLAQGPDVAAVLNVTPNHLDRHPDMADYIRAKGNLIRFQTAEQAAILNADDAVVGALPHDSRGIYFSLRSPTNGAWYDGEALWLAGSATPLILRRELRLRGDHNVANALAASAVAVAMGCSLSSIRQALRAFVPVPHRLEVVAEVDGITYVNDSIATSPERSIAALRAIPGPVVLIAGGRDKHLPMVEWVAAMRGVVRAVVLVGEAAPLIRAALDDGALEVPVVVARSFAETVPLGRSLAQAGDTVLLSPGCTSFDEFRDYVARGEAFRAAVYALSEPPA